MPSDTPSLPASDSRPVATPLRDTARTDRAQSMMDYTLGVSVFLLSVVVTFTLLSGVFTPFNAPVQSDQTSVANRLADQLLTNLTTQGTRNTLDGDRATAFFATNTSAEVRAWYRISDTVDLNVTLLTVDPGKTEQLGPPHDRRAVATAVRIVIDDGTTCEPTCRLIVRVW